MDAAPISAHSHKVARRVLLMALLVAPAATQLIWLMSNHFSRWPLRLGLPLLGGALLGWVLCRMQRAGCQRWSNQPERQRLLFELAAGTWPLLVCLPAALLRLIYPEGLIPYMVIAALVAAWLGNVIVAFLPFGMFKRVAQAGALMVLVLGLSWHLIGFASGTGRFDATRENRNPTPMPSVPMTVTEVKQWPHAFEQYFNDQFRGRMHLVSFASMVDLLVLSRNFNPLSVVQGEHGWLYRNSQERQLEYAYRWNFDPVLATAFDQTMSQRRTWMQARQQPFLVVFSPDKRSVHPEFIPQHPLEPGRLGKLDQILPHLDRAGIEHLDLRQALRESPHKAEGPLFYKHDVHWNLRGAWVADQVIADALRQRFHLPLTPDVPVSGWLWGTESWVGGDLARFMGDPTLFKEPVPMIQPVAGWRARLVQRGGRPGSGPAPVREEPDMDYIETWEVDDPSLPTAVIFHDSSGVCLRRFIRERFRRTVLVWSWFPSRAIIEQENPDVVIQLRGEEFADLLAMPDVQEFTVPPR